MHPLRRATCLALGLLAAASAACSDADQVAKIGVAYGSLPGGVQLAQAELDSGAGAGHPIVRFMVAPPRSDQAAPDRLSGEVDDAVRLTQVQRLVAVIGHASSRGSLLAAPVYNDAGVPQLVPSGTSRLLGSAGPWTFQLAPNDSLEGEFIARFAAERLRARTALIVYVTDEYGSGLRSSVAAGLAARGVRVLDPVPVRDVTRCPPSAGGGSPFPLVDAALRVGLPDVVVLAARTGVTRCVVERARALRLRGVRFVAGDGVEATEEWLPSLGLSGDSLFVVAFWHHTLPSERSRAFTARYRATFRTLPSPSSASIYDAATLLAAAVREVGTSRRRVRDYLRDLGVRRPPFPGVTGPVSFGPARRPSLYMLRPTGSGWVQVEAP